MSAGHVRVQIDQGVAHLTLTRPERRNALVGQTVEELLAAVRSTRPLSHALLLSGEGPHLCAGLDIDAFGAEPAPSWRQRFSDQWTELHLELWNEDRPLVVAHSGAAIGAGSALLFAADVAISGNSAFAHLIEVGIGMIAPVNLALLMARHSHSVAATMGLLGERTHAAELHRMGLVAEVVDDADTLPRALDRALLLASHPHEAVTGTRRALRRLNGSDIATLITSAQADSTGVAPKRPL